MRSSSKWSGLASQAESGCHNWRPQDMLAAAILIAIASGLGVFCDSQISAAEFRVDRLQDQDPASEDPLPQGALLRLGSLENAATGHDPPAAGHSQTITDVRYSPDGKWIATFGLDMTVRLWNAETGDLVRVFEEGKTDSPIGFSPDGTHLFFVRQVGGFQRQLEAWDIQSEMTVGTHGGQAKDEIAPDEIVVRNTDDVMMSIANGVLRQHELPSLREIPGPSVNLRFDTHLAFSPDGMLVAADNIRDASGVPSSAYREPGIVVYDIRQNRLRQPLSTGRVESARRIRFAFSLDRRVAACSDSTNVIHVWETATGAELMRFTGISSQVSALQFSPQGHLLVSADSSGRARLWSLETGREIPANLTHNDEVKSLAFSPDGSRLATASSDRTVLVWDMRPFEPSPPDVLPLTDEVFQELWSHLGSSDARTAFTAQTQFTASAADAIPLIHAEIDSLLEPSRKERIEQLIQELDSDEYMVRERATEELLRFRASAMNELRAALANTRSAEVRHRINRILSTPDDALRFPQVELLRAVRVVDLLERDLSEDSTRLLEIIADGFPVRDVINAAQAELDARK